MTIIVNLIFLAVGCSAGFVAGRLWRDRDDPPESTLDLMARPRPRDPEPWIPETARPTPIPADVRLDDVPPEIPPAKAVRRVPRPITSLAEKVRKPAARAKRVRRES